MIEKITNCSNLDHVRKTNEIIDKTNFLEAEAGKIHKVKVNNVELPIEKEDKSVNIDLSDYSKKVHGHKSSEISGLSDIAETGSYNDLIDKPTTLSGYGITNAYTKEEVNSKTTIATKEEAEAGINNIKVMSPLTVKQSIDKNALPIKGGTMKGTIKVDPNSRLIITNTVNDDYVQINGATDYNNGAYLILAGKSHVNSEAPHEKVQGAFQLTATNGEIKKSLFGNTEKLTWNGSEVITSAGGTMNEGLTVGRNMEIVKGDKTKNVIIASGTTFNDSPSLVLYPEKSTSADDSLKGTFHLRATKDNVTKILIGKSSGELLWNDKNVLTDDKSFSIVNTNTPEAIKALPQGCYIFHGLMNSSESDNLLKGTDFNGLHVKLSNQTSQLLFGSAGLYYRIDAGDTGNGELGEWRKFVEVGTPVTQLTGLSKVATSGNYTDLANKPTSLPASGGNASTVNNHTVESNVPANAKFTDTVYTHPANHPATMITGLANVAKTGNYSDLSNKPTTVVTVSALNDIKSKANGYYKFTGTIATVSGSWVILKIDSLYQCTNIENPRYMFNSNNLTDFYSPYGSWHA